MTIYHFVGIKGSGMSSLAQVLFDTGCKVQGSDVDKHFFTEDALVDRGIQILPFDENNIHKDMTIIAGNAFPDEHPEIAMANAMGIPVIRYHHFLADYLKKHVSIAVTGCHGKTSTTGLLSHVLKGAYPTSFLIGDGTGEGDEDAKYFVFEACEYRRHFLSYHPDYCIMTNIDFDHPDYYKNMDDVYTAFQEMVHNVSKAIVACGDDENLCRLQANLPIVYYGFGEGNEFQATNLKTNSAGTSFDVKVKGKHFDSFAIPNFGNHSVLNALSVIALCYYENCDVEIVKEQLLTFSGVKRRFTVKSFGSQILIDDYAHHPTEIAATLDSARKKFPDRDIVAIFQPHTFTRTQKFLSEFAEALSNADRIFLCDIFGSAREERGSLSIRDLCDKIPGAEILSEEDPSKLKEFHDSVLIFMGAGDVQKYQEAYEKL